MTRAPLLALCGVAALLATTVAVEFRQQLPAPVSAVSVPAVPTAATPAAAARVASVVQIQSWVATILARPLFSRDRRPTDAPAAVAAVAESLPRLTGITVSPAGRHAIFASPGNKPPLVASPGDHVAGFTVRSIEPGGVTVVGPSGPRVLQPSFEGPPHAAAGAADPVATARAAPELLGQLSSGRLLPGRVQFPEAEFNRLAQQPAP